MAARSTGMGNATALHYNRVAGDIFKYVRGQLEHGPSSSSDIPSQTVHGSRTNISTRLTQRHIGHSPTIHATTRSSSIPSAKTKRSTTS